MFFQWVGDFFIEDGFDNVVGHDILFMIVGIGSFFVGVVAFHDSFILFFDVGLGNVGEVDSFGFVEFEDFIFFLVFVFEVFVVMV